MVLLFHKPEKEKTAVRLSKIAESTYIFRDIFSLADCQGINRSQVIRVTERATDSTLYIVI
jgi:hypothetical protein